MTNVEIKEKPSWIIYVKAFGLFLISYCAIEAGHLYLDEGLEGVSFAYYGILAVIGVAIFVLSWICEKLWERPPI